MGLCFTSDYNDEHYQDLQDKKNTQNNYPTDSTSCVDPYECMCCSYICSHHSGDCQSCDCQSCDCQ